jgi:hypothetical protein
MLPLTTSDAKRDTGATLISAFHNSQLRAPGGGALVVCAPGYGMRRRYVLAPNGRRSLSVVSPRRTNPVLSPPPGTTTPL